MINLMALVIALYAGWWVGAVAVCLIWWHRLHALSGTPFLQWALGLVLASAVHKFFWWLHLGIGDAQESFNDIALIPLSLWAWFCALQAIRAGRRAIPPMGGLARWSCWIVGGLMLGAAVLSYWWGA